MSFRTRIASLSSFFRRTESNRKRDSVASADLCISETSSRATVETFIESPPDAEPITSPREAISPYRTFGEKSDVWGLHEVQHVFGDSNGSDTQSSFVEEYDDLTDYQESNTTFSDSHTACSEGLIAESNPITTVFYGSDSICGQLGQFHESFRHKVDSSAFAFGPSTLVPTVSRAEVPLTSKQQQPSPFSCSALFLPLDEATCKPSAQSAQSKIWKEVGSEDEQPIQISNCQLRLQCQVASPHAEEDLLSAHTTPANSVTRDPLHKEAPTVIYPLSQPETDQASEYSRAMSFFDVYPTKPASPLASNETTFTKLIQTQGAVQPRTPRRCSLLWRELHALDNYLPMLNSA